ncbi:adenine phosphoribosyltransferase isoform X2 [Erpetoichthys calabaricus]|uniref:adenine phosphoribosyltransferase isoform X2 n=1 Tax=Erpetoichthys calabaricus TaxID=27687 RepID=UPI002233E9F9|nr:adenine phosphoribosyltransferase isoform X2 [Erpetoichthys calabaricus]
MNHMDVWSAPEERHKGWYLHLMVPNTKGESYAWLDPSRLYCSTEGLQDCVKDLLQPFQGDSIDIVAGIDAMGFVLGSSIATFLNKGFLVIRKAGHLCVTTKALSFSDYSGTEKTIEVRTDILKKGLRVLLVDQWIETGGTMKAAIKLLEDQGVVIAGIAAICIENSEVGKWIKENYKCSHCVPEHLQGEFDAHYLKSFALYHSNSP